MTHSILSVLTPLDCGSASALKLSIGETGLIQSDLLDSNERGIKLESQESYVSSLLVLTLSFFF